jgi:hypothetical protein
MIGHLDIAFAVSSLSCFSASHGHFELAVYLFGYLKKYPNQAVIGSQFQFSACL